MAIRSCKKQSHVNHENFTLFFSLVDYRNNYFNSDDPNKIIEFYNGFENRDQLIQWMKERPKGVATIHEVDGDKDIIVVIPTADFNGKYAKECRDNIFKGLHIIFVESGEVPDPYFNYAHNCNVGIRKAMEYMPKWVVVSNDDMVKIDDVGLLKSKLHEISADYTSAVFTVPSYYHSYKTSIGLSIPIWTDFIREIMRFNRLIVLNFERLVHSKLIQNAPYIDSWGNSLVLSNDSRMSNLGSRLVYKLKNYFKSVKKELEIKSHIENKLALGSRNLFFSRFFLKKPIEFIMTSSFGIFSYNFCSSKEGSLFDDSYINGVEDWDLSIEIALKFKSDKKAYRIVDYKIGDYIGSSLGNSENRSIRNLANFVYLNFKNPLHIKQNK